jgi:peptidyl-tRNA hydrolase, PTH1 family
MPIRLIAGLGNPGRRHERDRHNVGFRLAERIAAKHRVALRAEPKYHAVMAKLALPGTDAWLVLPQTFMNLSGRAVGALARFYKIAPDEVLAMHDELDFAPGVAKLKLGGGVAGHNGLKDIAANLGSQGFWRLRIGIGHPGDKALVADYVLSTPAPAEREAIEGAIDKCLEVFPLIEAGQMEAAMLRLHTKPKEASDES